MLTYQQDVIIAGLRQSKVARACFLTGQRNVGASRNSRFGTSSEKPWKAFPGTPTGHRLPLREDAQRGRIPTALSLSDVTSTLTPKRGAAAVCGRPLTPGHWPIRDWLRG